MDTDDAPEGMILVGTDGSERAQRAVVWAAREAEIRGSKLTILTAWTPEHVADAALWSFGYSGSKLLEDIRAEQRFAAASLVEKSARSVRDRYPDLDVHVIVHEGDARDALVEYGRDASLIVVGSRGAGPIASAVVGSVAFWMTRHSEVPVAVVPTDAHRAENLSHHRGVVVGASLDPLSAKVVEAAAQEAEERRSDLMIAYCEWDGDAAKRRWDRVEEDDLHSLGVEVVEKLAAAVHEEFPRLPIRRRFARGAADHFLADISRNHEMLVVGRRFSSPLDFFEVGTMSAAVFREAPFVILVVPLTKADDEALLASGEILRPARVG